MANIPKLQPIDNPFYYSVDRFASPERQLVEVCNNISRVVDKLNETIAAINAVIDQLENP